MSEEKKKSNVPNSSQNKKSNAPNSSQNKNSTASPPSFINFEDLMKASNSVENMTLAHEIAINDEFILQKYEPSNNTLEGRIKETMMAAFWDILRSQLNSKPPEYTQAMNLLNEVRGEIKGLLLPNHERMKNQIDEHLDIDLIQQQLKKDAFDLRAYANFIINTMGKLCAPVRDDDIAHLKTIEDPVDLYKEIFRVLDLMKMDMANFTIAQMRPYIQQQSVAYEKKKFSEFLETQKKVNIDGLSATKSWLHTVYKDAVENSSQISPSILLCSAYLKLLSWNPENSFPECCVMDETRFLIIGEALSRLLLVSSLIVVTGSYYANCPDPSSLKETIKSHCFAIIEDTISSKFSTKAESLAEKIVLDIKEDSQKNNITIPNEKLTEMKRALILSVDSNHRVSKLLRDRLNEFILQMLLSNHRDPIQIPQGLSSVQNELSQLIGQLMRIVAHNRNVFGEYFDNIIEEMIKNSSQGAASKS